MPTAFPTVDNKTLIEKMTMRLVSNTTTATSLFSYKQQTQDLGGRRWEATITIRPLTHNESLAFQAFLTALDGTTGTFYLGNPLMKGNISANVTVNGAHSAGDTTISMSSANTGNNVPVGHHIAIGDHLYMALTEIVKNATQTITISPPLRENAVDDATVVVNQPQGVWRLKDPKVEYDISTSGHYSFSFACIEAV